MKICFSNNEPLIDNNSIFLAGPTKRNSSYDSSWRKEAVRILRDELHFDGIVYIPEYEPEVSFVESKEAVENQTFWEWKCLNAAGVILFWVPRQFPDMPAFTTNVEFGIYTEKKPESVILGYPDNAEKMRYLELRYNTVCKKESEKTLKETLNKAIKTLYTINSKQRET